jgi:hypothetical protein
MTSLFVAARPWMAPARPHLAATLPLQKAGSPRWAGPATGAFGMNSDFDDEDYDPSRAGFWHGSRPTSQSKCRASQASPK